MLHLGDLMKKKDDGLGKMISTAKNGMDLTKILVQSNVEKNKKRLAQKFKFQSSQKSARIHTKAVKYGYKPKLKGAKYICSCCLQNVRTRQLPMCENTTILSKEEGNFKVISGVALFFTFIKCLILFFIIRGLVVDGFNIITNLIEGKSCSGECVHQFFTKASIFHKDDRDDLINTTDLLAFITIFVSIIYFTIYRRVSYHIYNVIDEKNQTEDDYTIFVEDIPILSFPNEIDHVQNIDFNYDKDLQNMFKEEINKWLQGQQNEERWADPPAGTIQYDYHNNIQIPNGYEDQKYIPDDIVKSISLCYDIQQISRIHGIRQQIMTRHETNMGDEKYVEEESGLDARFDSPPEQIQFLNETQMHLTQSFISNPSLAFKTTHFIGCAFISFKYQHYRDYIIQKYNQNQKTFKLKGVQLRITEATHPSDVNWENLIVPRDIRFQRKLVSNAILIVILIFAFGILLATDFLKQFLERINNEFMKGNKGSSMDLGSKAITLLATVITLTINYFIQLFVYKFASWERNVAKTDEKFSLVLKLVYSQFVNTAFIYYFVSLINNKTNDDLLSASGLVYQVSSLITTSGVINIISNLLNTDAILRKLKLWWYYKGKPDKQNEFQVNLNKKFQHPEFDIAFRYAYYLLQLWTVSFYAYVVPIGVPSMAAIFFFQYWVDKFNLFRRSSLFYQIHFSLSAYIIRMAEFSIFVFAVGMNLFSYKVHHSVTVLNILSLVVSLVYILFVFTLPARTEKKLFRKYESLEDKSYDQCVKAGKFQFTFWTSNPVTMLIDEDSVTRRKVVKNEAAKSHIFLKQEEIQSIFSIQDYGEDNFDATNVVHGAVEGEEEEVEEEEEKKKA